MGLVIRTDGPPSSIRPDVFAEVAWYLSYQERTENIVAPIGTDSVEDTNGVLSGTSSSVVRWIRNDQYQVVAFNSDIP